MEADEVTYGMHIIIRFEIEKLLFNDQLTIAELPQAWNNLYEEYLGVEVPNDTLGVMQDLHYFNTYYGYFHGYFMGDLMGTQIHARMVEEIPEWNTNLAGGSLDEVIKWHTDHIYSKGALYTPLELVKNITGEELTADYFKNYLNTKYEN
jgi:carboxypeptidase Taq